MGYDTVAMLDAAVRDAGSNAPQKISTALKRMRDVPTVGGVVPVDANGDMQQPVSLFSLDGRTWKRIHETAGTRMPQESTPELR
jgi:ABC-type branched-subunit amino acid transport system substrate-binding protein